MGRQMIGAVALNAVRSFLKHVKFETTAKTGQVWNLDIEHIEGYVRFKTMFLNVSDPALKIKIFQQKNQILREVNLAINNVWYTTVVEEIRLKT